MRSIFLSASVPLAGRGTYLETADPFLIQVAVRELMTLALGRRRIVWGGHPAITPMIWSVCQDLWASLFRCCCPIPEPLFSGNLPGGKRTLRKCPFH